MANSRTKSETNVLSLDNNFNRKYALYNATPNGMLNRLETILCEETLFDNIQYMFQKSSELINSIRLYPFGVVPFIHPYDSGAPSLPNRYVPIGRISGQDVQINGLAIDGVRNNVLIASFTLTKGEYFYDFEPYSQMKIYLPYLGYYNLPVNEIRKQNCRIEVRYSVDFDTGMCTAYVNNATLNYTILIATGKIGVDIPLGATNTNEVTANILSSSLKMISGAITTLVGGNVGGSIGAVVGAGGIAKGIAGVTDLATHSVVHYTNGGLHGGSSNIASPNMCFIEEIKPQTTDIDMVKYRRLYGKPLHEIRNILDITGFTKIGEVHLENFVDATEPEIREIENLLKSGVIL